MLPLYKTWVTKSCGFDADDVEFDLFGNPIKVVRARNKKTEDETPTVPVCIKLTKSEHKTLCQLADKFGMSKHKYCRDAVRQIMVDHKMLLKP